MTQPQARLEREQTFVTALSELERGPLAELRRSLSYRTGQSYFLERLIFEHLPDWYKGGWGSRAAYLVAGLYALVERPHSDPKDRPEDDAQPVPPAQPRNLGYALGRLYRAQDERPSTEKRFLALLDADEDQLADHLRHAVALLNAGDLRPDWAQLLADVSGWNRTRSRDSTRDRWAKAFYRPEPRPDPAAPQEEPA